MNQSAGESRSTNEREELEGDPQTIDFRAADAAATEAAAGEESEANLIVKLRAELEEANARVLAARADLENYRKRLQRDTEQQLKFATLPLLRDVLEVGDNLHRALQASSQATAESVAQGVRMVVQQLQVVLSKHGCQQIEAIGKPFDPNVHEAISQMPSNEHPAGAIAQEVRTGYQLHDRVIRPSQVFLSTGPGPSA